MSIYQVDIIGLWSDGGWLTYSNYPLPLGICKRLLTTREFFKPKTDLAYFSYAIPIKARFFQAERENF